MRCRLAWGCQGLGAPLRSQPVGLACHSFDQQADPFSAVGVRLCCPRLRLLVRPFRWPSGLRHRGGDGSQEGAQRGLCPAPLPHIPPGWWRSEGSDPLPGLRSGTQFTKKVQLALSSCVPTQGWHFRYCCLGDAEFGDPSAFRMSSP